MSPETMTVGLKAPSHHGLSFNKMTTQGLLTVLMAVVHWAVGVG